MRMQAMTVVLALGLCVVAGSVRAQGVGERAGQQVDKALDALQRGAANMTEAVRERFEKARDYVGKMEVEARVYARLHWDKDLADTALELQMKPGGVAVLTGAVDSERVRQKATQLTADTVGVTSVENQLVVVARRPAAPAPPGNKR